jgi:DNA sulfur modification protein DndE
MELLKLKISSELTQKLRTLKARTGLTPNILCRIGFCLSLHEPGLPDTKKQPEDGMEFNRYTLTGQYDTLFLSLLKERCLEDGISLDDDNLLVYFLAHLNRGVYLIYNRIRGLADFKKLISY